MYKYMKTPVFALNVTLLEHHLELGLNEDLSCPKTLGYLYVHVHTLGGLRMASGIPLKGRVCKECKPLFYSVKTGVFVLFCLHVPFWRYQKGGKWPKCPLLGLIEPLRRLLIQEG